MPFRIFDKVEKKWHKKIYAHGRSIPERYLSDEDWRYDVFEIMPNGELKHILD